MTRRHESCFPFARISARLWADTRGASAVEMALVFPVFLVLIIGALSFAIYLGAAHSVQQLAADAARSSVAGLDDTERAQLSQEYVAANAEKYPLLRASAIAVDARPSNTDARDFVVSIVYDARDLPIWQFSELVSLPSQEISRVSVIRRGGDK